MPDFDNSGVVTTAPENSNQVIEGQLDWHIKSLEKTLNADVLAFVAPLYDPLDVEIRDSLEWRIKQGRKRRKLAVMLETSGGLIEITQRIANTLRKHYKVVDFIIPDSAMSAGTVLVMSGDSIWMDYFSVLGPIDPQVLRDGRWIPALGYLKQYERLIEKSNKGELTTAELHYLVENFDAAEMYSFEQAREMSVTLVGEWLAKFKFKNWKKTKTSKIKVTPTMRKERARKIAEKLNDTDHWHSHRRGISMGILRKDLNLKIEDFEKDRETFDKIRGYWKLLTDYMTRRSHPNVIHVKGQYRQI